MCSITMRSGKSSFSRLFLILSKQVVLGDDWNAILDPDLDRGRAREDTNILSDVKKKKTFTNLSPYLIWLINSEMNI